MVPSTKLIETIGQELLDDDRITLILAPLDDMEISVEHLRVDPSFRGTGLARRTMERLTELADEAGIELHLYAAVPRDEVGGLEIDALRDFYARRGYETMDQENAGFMRRLPDPSRSLTPMGPVSPGRRIEF